MTTPTVNEARRAILQIEAQFQLPPAALALFAIVSGYLESVPAAQVQHDAELARLKAQLCTCQANDVCAYQHHTASATA